MKVRGYLPIWQIPIEMSFWESHVQLVSALHQPLKRLSVLHMTKHLVLIVDFCRVCLLTSPCPFITRSAFIFCHSETFFSFSFPFSVVFLLAVCSIQPFQSESSQSLRKGSLCRALSPGFLVEQLRYCPLFWGDAGFRAIKQNRTSNSSFIKVTRTVSEENKTKSC